MKELSQKIHWFIRRVLVKTLVAWIFVMPLLVFSTPSYCKKLTYPMPKDFPIPKVDDVIAFIGTVESFATPVYGVAKWPDPVSIMKFNVEENLTGNAEGQEIVSYGAVYRSKFCKCIVKTFGPLELWTYLKPGQRVFAVAHRRNEADAANRGYFLGGRYLISFVRILPSNKTTGGPLLKVVDVDISQVTEPSGNSKITAGWVNPRQFKLVTEVDERTLVMLRTIVAEMYGGQR